MRTNISAIDQSEAEMVAVFDINDQSVAKSDGWMIVETHGISHGNWYLQRLGGASSIFSSDRMAWEHVVSMTRNGSPYHALALEFIAKENPSHYKEIFESLAALEAESVDSQHNIK